MTAQQHRIPDTSVLDDPFNAALRGPQAHLARSRGAVVSFDPQVGVFYGTPRELSADDYTDLALLGGLGNTVSLRDRRSPLPDAGLRLLETVELVQYSGADIASAHDDELVVLGADDVPEMTALVELTRPGPFLPRTIETGTYLGYREPGSGRLLAMGGQRLHVPGWKEISAVCTHPDARGRGLASRIIGAVAQVTRDEGLAPFLHTSGDNPARGLYESLGFHHRSTVSLEIFRVTSVG